MGMFLKLKSPFVFLILIGDIRKMPMNTLDKNCELLLKQGQESLQFANRTVSGSQVMLDLWLISLKSECGLGPVIAFVIPIGAS
jgi:hypothetical protein